VRASRPNFVTALRPSQISALVATAFDFGTLFFFYKALGLWYVAATAIGAAVGAIVNYLLNRFWSFEATHAHWRGQAGKYVLVSAMSLLLNTGGVYLFKEFMGFQVGTAKVITSLGVALFFNFPLHRGFVFR
jgi:putative flippase GtrA